MKNLQNQMTANISRTLKKSLLISLGTIALSIGVAQTAKAGVLTFDDVATTNSTANISNGYGGLNWDNFYVINKNSFPNSGYDKGTVSGNYTAFNWFANPTTVSSVSNKLFDFNSAFITSAWANNNSISIEGFTGGVSKYLKTVVVNTNAPTKFDFNFLGIDKLRFTSLSGTWFAMDNFTFNERVTPPNPTSVPEPGLLAGLFIITPSAAAWLKRNKLKQAVE
jgi:hypothetical protein